MGRGGKRSCNEEKHEEEGRYAAARKDHAVLLSRRPGPAPPWLPAFRPPIQGCSKGTDNWSVKRYSLRTKGVKFRGWTRLCALFSLQGTIRVKAQVRCSRYALRMHRETCMHHEGRSRSVRLGHGTSEEAWGA